MLISLISPEAVQNFYPNYPLNYDPFEVTNVHGISRNDYSVTLPCFNEFNENNNIKLFVYRFHDYFDGLIGLDLLSEWQAKIDLKDFKLITRNATNFIKVYNSRNINLYEDIIPGRSSKLVKIPINAPDGEVFINEQVFCNCIIHECLTTVTGSRGYVEIENPSPNDVIFSLDQPAYAEVFNINCEPEKKSNRVNEVLSRLRTDHLNEEEKANLLTLCTRYSDVFYIDGEPLTFTNKIKHRIRTKDEVPVYTKSYQYPFIHRQEVRDQISKMLQQGIIN